MCAPCAPCARRYQLIVGDEKRYEREMSKRLRTPMLILADKRQDEHEAELAQA